MPSLSSSSTSVFGRFAGKRATINEQLGAAGGRLSPPLEALPEVEKRSIANGHRRESSILSLPSSVSDLGHNVKRSVSLRSHRTQPSGSGSITQAHGHKRFPSSGQLINASLTTSPIEDEETSSSIPPPPFDPPPPPRSRGKLSISARSLSSKFKSTDNLPTISPPPQPEDDPERPTTAVDISKAASSSMLHTPGVPRRAPPERPPLQPQASFTRDISSSHGANGASLQQVPTLTSVPTGAQNPQLIYHQIHETSAKRMATIEYLRKVHDGNIFYFSTLHYSPASLQAFPSMQPLRMARRANNYLVLGYSLPALLDLNSGTALEYLKALSALLQEFETYQTLTGFDSSGNTLSRGRVGQMFKSGMGLGSRAGKGRRASAATDSISIQNPDLLGLPKSGSDSLSPLDTPSPISPSGHDFQHLVTPHLPFDPDFSTTFATLCDTLIDTYAKLLDLVSSPDYCTPATADAFVKADKAVRKILIANIVREFEDNSRAAVKSEVAGLGKLVLSGLM